MDNDGHSPVRVSEMGTRLTAATSKMELHKPYRIQFSGEDLLVVWTGHQLELYELIDETSDS